MEYYFGVTDNSVSTQHRYDLVAEHNVEAYKKALRSSTNNPKEDEMIFGVLLYLLKYIVIIPVFTILKFVILLIIRTFKRNWEQKKSLLKTSKIKGFRN